MTAIHATALVDASAVLADSVKIGPYAVIGAGVQIDAGTVIGSHCTIGGPTIIGRNNVIHAHASLGGAPQDMKYRGEPTQLVIGDDNTIFEFCTFSRGTVQDAGVTRIGNANWLMAYVHIAHDVQVGNHTVMASYAALAGHAQLGDWAIIGGMTGVHQFCKVGAHVITGFQSHVSLDIPPFMMASGNPLAVYGFNVEGLRRRGFSRERMANIKQMHRLLYRDGLTLNAAQDAIAALRGQAPGAAGEAAPEGGGGIGGGTVGSTGVSPQAGTGTSMGGTVEIDQDVQMLLDFLASAKRGIAR